MSEFGIDPWTELSNAIGLDQAKGQQWHRLFEQPTPPAYQDFLESLGLSVAEIKHLRAARHRKT